MKTKKSNEDSYLIKKKSSFKLNGRGKQVVSFFFFTL